MQKRIEPRPFYYRQAAAICRHWEKVRLYEIAEVTRLAHLAPECSKLPLVQLSDARTRLSKHNFLERRSGWLTQTADAWPGARSRQKTQFELQPSIIPKYTLLGFDIGSRILRHCKSTGRTITQFSEQNRVKKMRRIQCLPKVVAYFTV